MISGKVDARVLVMLNAWRLSPMQRTKLASATRGRTTLWCYAADYIHDGGSAPSQSITHFALKPVSAAAWAEPTEMGKRRGIDVSVIPNVMDFDNPPKPPDEYTSSLRADLGVAPDEHFFLQPTRPLQRKGIEYAIELIRRLGEKARLVISHPGGDEGKEYVDHVRTLAGLMDVRVDFVSDLISTGRGTTKDGRKIYTLGDVYPYADLVTFPSLLEGFGNAFLETVYYRRPIFINNYTIYSIDIKPKGFQAVEFNGFITDETVKHVQKILSDPKTVQDMTERNYELGKQFYSFTVLERQLQVLLHSCFSREAWGW